MFDVAPTFSPDGKINPFFENFYSGQRNTKHIKSSDSKPDSAI
jgi:hypothetical protein